VRTSDWPKSSETKTYHVHDDQTWEWGVTCEACVAPPFQGKGKSVNFNIARLQAENVGAYTQQELAREVTDAADRDGREIEHPR
jgi:hypothetical protein